MVSNLVKLTVLSAALGLPACATHPVAATQGACECACNWAQDRGEPRTGTYTFTTSDASCPAATMGSDVPCRGDDGQMHVSGSYADCRYVPVAAP